jgi:hypothetical protein
VNSYALGIRGVSPYTLIEILSKNYPLTLLNMSSFGTFKHEALVSTEAWVSEAIDFYKINDGTFVSYVTEMRESEQE